MSTMITMLCMVFMGSVKRVMLERQTGSLGRRSITSVNITKTNTNAITNAKTNTCN